MGREASHRSDAEIDGGLAEIDRLQLGVKIGEMEKRHLAFGLEGEELILGDRLLGSQPSERSGACGQSGRCQHDLHEIPARQH